MTRGWLIAFAVPAALAVATRPARAQEDAPGCPPGEWFCDDSEGEAPPPVEAEPDDSGDDGGWTSPEPSDAAPARERRVDVSTPAPSSPTERAWSEGSGGRASSPWGLALRVE